MCYPRCERIQKDYERGPNAVTGVSHAFSHLFQVVRPHHSPFSSWRLTTPSGMPSSDYEYSYQANTFGESRLLLCPRVRCISVVCASTQDCIVTNGSCVTSAAVVPMQHADSVHPLTRRTQMHPNIACETRLARDTLHNTLTRTLTCVVLTPRTRMYTRCLHTAPCCIWVSVCHLPPPVHSQRMSSTVPQRAVCV